jgi:ribosomal protein S18 acetylase RimI-like enzyme
MDPRYRIRPAKPEDPAFLPAIEVAAARLFVGYLGTLGLTDGMLQRTDSVEDLLRAQEAGLLWIAAEEADAPVGFAYLVELEDALHLDELRVHPWHGRRGLGTELLAQVCAQAGSAGRAVTLSTFRDVPWNAPFFARHGFRVMEEAEWTPGLVALREGERRRGARVDLRVLMRHAGGAR